MIINGKVKINGKIYKKYSINNNEIKKISILGKELKKRKRPYMDI